MNFEKKVRQSPRKLHQRFLTDPLVALVAYSFWGLFKILPVRVASGLGGKLGRFAGCLLKRRNHIGMVNLKFAFPEKSEAERRQILNKMWEHWGRFYAEMPHATELFKSAELKGLPLLKKMVQDGKGGFLCSAHIGNWELAVSQPLFDDFCLNPVYRRANNPWLDKLMFQRRAGILIPKGAAGARKMIDVLRNKGVIVMLCDQKLNEGIDVPFFGKMAKTAPAIATLALKFKAPIAMARSIRQPDGHFILEMSAPLKIPTEDDKEQATLNIMTQINTQLESWIRENPEQWLWIHRRFDKSEYR
ncbi:MAG: lysophospholipid acyltransferase family protein [Alphaproteobacteria bacterium]|nr:lysophospholipid acyltransferase family protein [Alphaproteobacteria bacterium]